MQIVPPDAIAISTALKLPRDLGKIDTLANRANVGEGYAREVIGVVSEQ